jgi:hypothetical protein
MDRCGSATIGSALMHVTAEQMANSADTLQAEQMSVGRQMLPPCDMLTFIQSPQDQASASKCSQV